MALEITIAMLPNSSNLPIDTFACPRILCTAAPSPQAREINSTITRAGLSSADSLFTETDIAINMGAVSLPPHGSALGRQCVLIAGVERR